VKILSQGDYPVSFGTGGKNSLPFISVWAIIDGMHNSLGSFVNRKYVIACVTIQSCDAAWETRALCVNLPRGIRTPIGYAGAFVERTNSRRHLPCSLRVHIGNADNAEMFLYRR